MRSILVSVSSNLASVSSSFMSVSSNLASVHSILVGVSSNLVSVRSILVGVRSNLASVCSNLASAISNLVSVSWPSLRCIRKYSQNCEWSIYYEDILVGKTPENRVVWPELSGV